MTSFEITKAVKGTVFDIKEFGIHDGPGLRTTIFLKGCPLRCVWCHNPEGLSPRPEISYKKNVCIGCLECQKECSHTDCKPFGRCLHVCPKNALSVIGKEYTDDELIKKILKNYDIIKDGGVTFSGGEPLLQHEFLISLLEKLDGVLPRAIETSGFASPSVFKRVIDLCELVYMDIKIADPDKHLKYTGVSNDLILENLEILRNSGVKCIIRTPLIPNINDSSEEKEKILSLVKDLNHEFLPFNTLAGAKYNNLGKEFPYETLKTKGSF